MKKGFYILLGLLVLVALFYWAYKKFVDQPQITAEIFLSKMLTEKKIFYRVNYSGFEFNGVYDMNQKEFQDHQEGKYKIRTFKDGQIFGLELLKNDKVIKSLSFDLLKQKLKIKA